MIDKKAIKKKYKETVQPMGIYRIKNNVNEKIFIGVSKNLNGKINSCRFQLKNGSYIITELQADYNKYGEENFSFDVIDRLEPKEDLTYDYTEDLAVLEEMWLEKLEPYGEKGYNKTRKKK